MSVNVNLVVSEEEHEWLKKQRKINPRFVQKFFLADAVTKAINAEKRKSK